MSSCGLSNDSGAPILNLQMLGRGEDAMRMDKRLRCAGRALGVAVHIDWKSNQYGDPKVYCNGQLLTDHLLNTTDIEKILKPFADTLLSQKPNKSEI